MIPWILLWLKSDSGQGPEQEADSSSRSAVMERVPATGYDAQREALSPDSNLMSPDFDPSSLYLTPSLDPTLALDSGPSMGVAPELRPELQNCDFQSMIDRIDRKEPGFRIEVIKAGSSLARTSPMAKEKVLMRIAEEQRACQAGR